MGNPQFVMGKVEVIDVSFNRPPIVAPRSISKGLSKEIRKGIEKRPFIVLHDVRMTVTFKYNNIEYVRSELITKGYTYNYADIPWILERITYDKHSPYMRIPSLCHDRLLDRREEIYDEWGLKDIMSRKDFRKLTSLVFVWSCYDSGVPYKKAKVMGKSVDIFQTVFF